MDNSQQESRRTEMLNEEWLHDTTLSLQSRSSQLHLNDRDIEKSAFIPFEHLKRPIIEDKLFDDDDDCKDFLLRSPADDFLLCSPSDVSGRATSSTNVNAGRITTKPILQPRRRMHPDTLYYSNHLLIHPRKMQRREIYDYFGGEEEAMDEIFNESVESTKLRYLSSKTTVAEKVKHNIATPITSMIVNRLESCQASILKTPSQESFKRDQSPLKIGCIGKPLKDFEGAPFTPRSQILSDPYLSTNAPSLPF